MVMSGVEVADSEGVFTTKEALVTVSWRYLPLEWAFSQRRRGRRGNRQKNEPKKSFSSKLLKQLRGGGVAGAPCCPESFRGEKQGINETTEVLGSELRPTLILFFMRKV
jgi:hypothetical protein